MGVGLEVGFAIFFSFRGRLIGTPRCWWRKGYLLMEWASLGWMVMMERENLSSFEPLCDQCTVSQLRSLNTMLWTLNFFFFLKKKKDPIRYDKVR